MVAAYLVHADHWNGKWHSVLFLSHISSTDAACNAAFMRRPTIICHLPYNIQIQILGLRNCMCSAHKFSKNLLVSQHSPRSHMTTEPGFNNDEDTR
jgi:hypothetical protein